MGWIVRELKDWWYTYTEDLPLFPAFVAISSMILVILAEVYGSAGFFRRNLASMLELTGIAAKLGPHIYWYLASFVIYGLIPLAVIVAFRKNLKGFGLGLGDWRLGLKVLGVFSFVMVMVVAIAVQTPMFAKHYPLNKSALAGLSVFFVYEACYVAYFFAWEFIWRGYVLFALYPHIKNWAIIVQTIPFVLLHIGKPVPEVFASVFAGLILGALALRTRSMLYGWWLHALSATAMDVAVYLLKTFR